jgi:plastocyanin
MNRTRLIAGSLLALFAVSASAADHTVIARPDRTFDPPTLTIAVGDTVTFMNDPDSPGFHNAQSDTGSVTQFRCANGCDGDGGNGDADSNLWTATVAFPVDATIGYHCEIHGADGGIGMSGTITVGNGGGAPEISVDPTSITATADEGASTIVPLSIVNSGTADLDWTADTASADCATPDTVPWLSLAPTSGTVAAGDPPASVDVTLDASALTPGTYGANVCVHSNDAANDPVMVPVQLTVGVSAADEIFTDGFDP